MTGSRPEWDEERLKAAFRSRAELAPSTPADLPGAVLDQARRRRGPNLSLGWLAAAASVVILLGAVSVMREGHDPRLAAPGATGSDPGGRGGAPTSAVASALGDPISVSTAIAIRDGTEHGDRELLVAGYLSPGQPLMCPLIPAGRDNPTHLVCPQSFQWLMERPEIVMATGPDTVTSGPPNGPAIHPSFALVDPPAVPIPASGGVPPLPVVLVGHFHDRRAALCEAADAAACGQTFVVDRVAVVNDAQRVATTVRRLERFDEATKAPVTETPRDLEADVDRLVLGAAPGAILQSRLLVTIDQVVGLEPALADDPVLSHWGDPTSLMWIETVVDVRGGVALPRTFALIDGSNWFAEITPDGAVMHERRAARGQTGSDPTGPSADPSAFDSAPTTVLGITVRDIATLERDRRTDVGDLGRDEMAIRAWYVAPRPGVECPPTSAVAVSPPCDEARRWLLDGPDQLGTELGQLRADPDHWPPVLNPLVPPDVPFQVTDTWVGDEARPEPVIVLGHFEDHRVTTYAGNLWFVIDALAWTRGQGSLAIDSLVRLTPSATEDVASVLARVDAVTDTPAVATWTTVVDAATFATLDPHVAEDAPEFTTGGPVWIVRRLVPDVMDGRSRLAIQWGFTADEGSRVWLTSQPDAPADLATTIDLASPDPHTDVVEVFDYGVGVTAVQQAEDRRFDWKLMNDERVGVEIARGESERQVAIRWTAGACDRDWQLRLRPGVGGAGSTSFDLRTFDDYCPEKPAARSLVLVFDRPVDLDAFHVEYNPSGG